MLNKLTIFTDGGARGNPGPAAIGIVITHKSQTGSEETKTGEYIGETTNNVAEYSALIKALDLAKEQNGDELECFLDSELVVKQLNGQYKVKDQNLKILWLKIKDKEKNFKSVTYTHIPRAKNKAADKIVNEVLDSLNSK